jgi:hypothetical protein
LPLFIGGNEYRPASSLYTVVVKVSPEPRAETPIPARGLPSADFTLPDNSAGEAPDCEKMFWARATNKSGSTARTAKEIALFRGKTASHDPVQRLQRLQIRDQIIDFLRFEPVLKAGHVRSAL